MKYTKEKSIRRRLKSKQVDSKISRIKVGISASTKIKLEKA